MEESKKKLVMILIIVVCLGVAGAVQRLTPVQGGFDRGRGASVQPSGKHEGELAALGLEAGHSASIEVSRRKLGEVYSRRLCRGLAGERHRVEVCQAAVPRYETYPNLAILCPRWQVEAAGDEETVRRNRARQATHRRARSDPGAAGGVSARRPA